MKALAVRQPWAWCIISGGKDIENRDWRTRYRGTVLIHASAGMTRREYEEAAYAAKMAQFSNGETQYVPEFDQLQRGGIIGQVDIVDCVTASASPWFFGEYGFVLENPKPLPFALTKGMLGFFDVPNAKRPGG